MSESPFIHEYVCTICLGIGGRLVSRTDPYLYIRCETCGKLSVMRERRRPWMPGHSLHRRATDLPPLGLNDP